MRKTMAVCLALLLSAEARPATWEAVNVPDAKIDSTQLLDISGSSAVGQYYKPTDNYVHSFFYDDAGKSYKNVDPQEARASWPKGVSGNNVAGSYNDVSGNLRHYFYDGGKHLWTTLNVPGIAGVNGILGNIVVGGYDSGGSHHGFLWEAGSWSVFEPTGATSSYPVSVSDNQVVGSYYDAGGKHIFVYDNVSRSWTTIDKPGFPNLFPVAVDGQNVIGHYQVGSSVIGFLYDGKNWLDLIAPHSLRTDVADISGNYIVGQYTLDDVFHTRCSFLYEIDKGAWTDLEMPGAKTTSVSAIYGEKIVGHFNDPQGFVLTVPEPSTFVLLVFVAGAVACLRLCRFAFPAK